MIALTGNAQAQAQNAPSPAQRLRGSILDERIAPGTGTTLPETVVTAKMARSYRAETATSATRLAEPILDTARSVQVVTRQLIEDRKINDPQEAAQNVSGVQRGASFTGPGENFVIRGFVQQDVIKDGFRAGTASNSGLSATGPTDVANLERIEVVKGPTAILYGRGEPGGLVNYITRTPAFENRFSIEQQFGSDEFYRTVLGANWEAVPGKVALRVDAAYERNGSFIDFVSGERYFAAPAIVWKISQDTTLTFRGEYSHDQSSTNPGVPYLDGRVLPGIPYSRYFGEPGLTDFTAETWRGLLQLDHRWNEHSRTALSLHGITAHNNGAYFTLFNYAGGPTFDPVTGDVSRGIAITNFTDDNITARIDQVFEWTLHERPAPAGAGTDGKSVTAGTGFAIKNQLLLSAEFERQANDTHRLLGGQEPLNAFDPRYRGYQPIPLIPFPGFPLNFDEKSDTEANAYSLVFQDRISFGETAYLSFGGRVEWFDAAQTFSYPATVPFPSSANSQDQVTFNPSAGLVVKPARNVSIYGSYAEADSSFINVGKVTVNGEALDPEHARQYEVGVKMELFERRLIATASIFQIEKSDVAAADPANPFFSINAGDERSRGFEFDLAGEPLPGWRIQANYAYIDARVTYDPLGLNNGHRRYGVPEHSGGVFTTYEIQDGPLKGLGFGGGVFLADRTEIDNANTGDLSGWAQTDAVVFYQRRNFRAQLNVKNLFDNEFYYSTGFGNTVTPAAGRAIIGSVRFEF
jgi:iron complex outermembrane receptor protein